MLNDIKKIIADHKNALEILTDKSEQLQKITLICEDALKAGNKIIFFGNGGSAADSQHLAAEFVGRFQKNRKPLPSLALSTNTSILTAVGNDFGFEKIFSRQIDCLGESGDVAFGISTSGNSANVLEAFKSAKKNNLYSVAFLGKDGGEIANNVDPSLVITIDQTPRIQEIHILAGHIICELIEKSF